MKRISIRVALCTVLISGVLAGFAAPASADCETVWVKAYEIDIQAERPTYRVGETAHLDATVTRSDTGAPVSGANFFAVLIFEDSLVYDITKTDTAGRADVDLKLKKNYVELGPARLRAVAYYEVADATCAKLVEYGQRDMRKAFTIKP